MDTYAHKTRIAAHRGYSALYPENTMAAYRAAVKLPIDQIEIDLHMTKDGRIIMMHDHKVDRTCDGEGLVREKTYAEIRALDAGTKKGAQFAGEKVPAFEEFLELMQQYPEMTVNVELKDYPEDDREWAFRSAEESLKLLEKYDMFSRIWINSWSATMLDWVDQRTGHALRLHGYWPFSCFKPGWERDPFSYLHCACLWGKDTELKKEDADTLAAHGVEPWVFAHRDEDASYRHFDRIGAMLITTNDPEKCVLWQQKNGLR